MGVIKRQTIKVLVYPYFCVDVGLLCTILSVKVIELLSPYFKDNDK